MKYLIVNADDFGMSREVNEGIKKGVLGTPTFFLNGKKIENPNDITGFQKYVDAALKEARDTSVPQPTKAPEASPTAASGNAPLPLQ